MFEQNDSNNSNINFNKYIEIALDNLRKIFSDEISAIIEYMKVTSSSIPYFRKYEIINMNCISVDDHWNFYWSNIFHFELERRIACLYENVDTANWYFDYSTFVNNPCFYQIGRKVIVSNMKLRPIVVTEQRMLNGLSLPLHFRLETPQTSNNMPMLVINLGNVRLCI